MTKKNTELHDHGSRAHALLSASSAERWLHCPPSAVASEAYPKQDTAFTQEGTIAHEVAEAVLSGRLDGSGSSFRGEDITVEMLECAKGYADYVQELITTGDALVLPETRVDFSPWVPGGFGTADCIIIQDRHMDVIDYKYGKGVAVEVKDNAQELCYGLGALNDYGFAYDVETVRLHIYQPRMNNISTWELTAAELGAWGESIRPVAALASDGKGEYSAGSWCRFCPHAGRCRALTALCTETVEVAGLHAEITTLAPHEVAAVLELEPLITLWLRRVKEQALTDLLEGKRIPGYKVVEGKLGNRKWTDEVKVLEALKAAGYQTEDVTETKLLSPAGMDSAIGKKKAAELLKDLIERGPGAPTIAAETDKRPAYDRLAEAQKDFS